MAVSVRVASILKQFTDDKELIEVQGTTVGECLNDLMKKYPETRRWLFDANNSPVVWVLLNQEIVLPGDNFKEINEGDEIDLIPMVAGG